MTPYILGLGLCLWITSCSPPGDPGSTGSEKTSKSAKTELPTPLEPPPPPPPEFTIVFEFEGISPKLLNESLLAARTHLRIRQELLRFDESGAPINRGDLYVLSPRSIPHFIARDWVAGISGKISLEHINPTFSFHRFDPGNKFSVPFRWSPVVSLHAVPPETETGAKTPPVEGPPQIPEDPPVITALGLASPDTEPSQKAPAPPKLPEPEAYRRTWNAFVSGDASSIRLPAACPVRNLGKETIPSWTWEIPGNRTVIFFDHLLIDKETGLADEAMALISHLISARAQAQLPENSGYFPVVVPLGHEKSASPITLPRGDWLQNSSFISGDPFFPPPPEVADPPSLPLEPQTVPRE